MSAPFRWGLFGAGEVALKFGLSVAQLPDHCVAAVASRSVDRARMAAGELHGAKVHADYATLCADPDIDAVYIATPVALRRDHVAMALEAGKPVLCEKPFARNGTEALELADLARSRGVFCMEAMWMRFIPAVRALRDRIAAGEIGEIRILQAELGFAMYRGPGVGARAHEGSVLDLGVYPLSLAWFLLGPPDESRMLTLEDDARASILLGYASGALATLSCGFDQRLRNGAFVAGTTGTFSLGAPLYAPETLSLTRTPEPGPSSVSAAGPGSLADRLSRTNPVLIGLRRRLAPALRQLLRQERSTRRYPFRGYGYQFEAAEVARCVRDGLLESPDMTLDETVEILSLLDRLRADGQGRQAQ